MGVTRRELFKAVLGSTLPQTRPVWHPNNPVLVADKPWEGTCAMPFSGGVWRDRDELKCFYMGGYNQHLCLATSEDGIHWKKPNLSIVRDTNIIWPADRDRMLDSTSVWLDAHAGRSTRWKMTLSHQGGGRLRLFTSPDAIRWSLIGEMPSVGDRTTMFFNPKRGLWSFAIRTGQGTDGDPRRCDLVESVTFPPTAWKPQPWLTAPAPYQLYAMDVAPYQDRLVGLMTLWHEREPANPSRPKSNIVALSMSADGRAWSTPQPWLLESDDVSAWNFGNVQSAGGCFVDMDDELWFYASGRKTPTSCAMGVATMRKTDFNQMVS